MKSLSALICCCVLLVSAMAENVPSLINYQGRLTEQNGTAVSNGVYRIAFRIWNEPTSPTSQLVWGREYDVVLRDGAFNVILGDAGNPIAGAAVNDLAFAFDAEELYLGLTIQKTPTGPIANPNEIVPRQRLLSTPFAITAQRLVKEAAEQLSPPGTVVAWMGTNNVPPDGWEFCWGQVVGRKDPRYARLYSVIGTANGEGNNLETFHLPDFRGMFLRGVNGTRENRLEKSTWMDPDVTSRTNSAPGGATGNAVGSVQFDELRSHQHTTPGRANGGSGAGVHNMSDNSTPDYVDITMTVNPAGGRETRPKNVYVQYLIKL